ncbi:MAG: hypothetical protein QF415_04580 [Candidatus Undinarchaeales archaeon]|jgi:hypothetical protein|nr:hypothetical protein [Candidatus Undinarchaeales archaeon]MDP7492524.1 hypothetical protein [Candidatus Undinarchaeales archaeon]
MTDKCDVLNYVCEPKEPVDWFLDPRTLGVIVVLLIVLAWAMGGKSGK